MILLFTVLILSAEKYQVVYMYQITLLVLYLAKADRICLQPLLILSSGLDGLLGKRLPLSSLSIFIIL
jgi:hypothetical protein